MSIPHYIFEDGKTKPCDLADWVVFFECCDRQLCETLIGDIVWVSTIFLGLNHRFCGDGLPIVWETMIFDYKLMRRSKYGLLKKSPKTKLPGDLNGYQTRHCTEAQARRGHKLAVERVREFYPDLPVIECVHECGGHLDGYDQKALAIRESFSKI